MPVFPTQPDPAAEPGRPSTTCLTPDAAPATDLPATPGPRHRDRRVWPWVAAIGHRWPTWLALAMVAVSVGGQEEPTGLAEGLLVFALGYLGSAVVQRRQATWLIAVVAIGTAALLRLQDQVAPSTVLLAAAAGLVLWAAVRGRLRTDAVKLETAGMLLFGGIAITAMAVDPELGLYLVAAGWLGHAVWDIAHLRADKVVSRSFAEWCAVFDGLRGIGILVAAVLL
jgi:hypothetical protein